jgi:DUF4097 and DUF4098 domain-containing protein YvlB
MTSRSCLLRYSLKAAVAPAALLLLAAATPASAHRVEKRFSVQARPVVTVRNWLGKITAKSWPKQEVMVVADHVSERTEVDVEQAGNRIDVLTHRLSENVSPEQLEANCEISVPEETELEVRTDAGSVVVEHVAGDMTFDTVAANVDLKEVSGYLVIKTVGGSLTCTRCAGRIEFTSISGNANLAQPISSNVRAQTSSGRVFFDGDFLRGGVYVLRTYSGPIEVRFSDSDSFQLTATSVNGQVASEANLNPPSHNRRPAASRLSNSLVGTFNEGLARVDLTSFSGTIKILKRQ